jgi:hypothetical protein
MRIIVILLIGGKPHPKFRMRRGEIGEQRVHRENRNKEMRSFETETVEYQD